MRYTIEKNVDTGSLFIGSAQPAVSLKVGDKIKVLEGAQVLGEKTCTYVMGTGAKGHACFKGAGPFHAEKVVFEVIGTEE